MGDMDGFTVAQLYPNNKNPQVGLYPLGEWLPSATYSRILPTYGTSKGLVVDGPTRPMTVTVTGREAKVPPFDAGPRRRKRWDCMQSVNDDLYMDKSCADRIPIRCLDQRFAARAESPKRTMPFHQQSSGLPRRTFGSPNKSTGSYSSAPLLSMSVAEEKMLHEIGHHDLKPVVYRG